MKKFLMSACLLLTVVALHARAIQEDYRNAEENARASYAFGMLIGENLDLGSMGIDFDYNAIAEGIRAVVSEMVTPELTMQEAVEIVETAIHNAQERATNANRLREEEFLAANRQRPEVKETESGLQYEIIEEAEGEKPIASSVVRVNYAGTFIDGSMFDRSSEEEGALIPLELVIPGWTEGLLLMSPGSIYKFFIPSELAYGKDGIQGIIPPYSTLIFSVELLEIINETE